MVAARGILLTGATGLLGRYLLRDLLARGRRVGVLVRDSGDKSAADRLAELVAFGSETLGRTLPRPVLLHGDLTAPGLGLGTAERRWLARQAESVVHSAAYVCYQPRPDGEPWQTNVHGTRRLLELCRSLGLNEVHHLSTAFVCGDRRGVVQEDELDCGGGGGNAYEQSKFAAEQMIRGFDGIRATIYRPSVVVGDSRTGYTSTYHHFYRFLELAVRLSSGPAGERGSRPRRHRLPLRLPLTGEETQNLVPVDWVSQALVELLHRPRWHGRTYHLTARQSVRLQEIKAIIEDLLHLEGLQWVGRTGLTSPTSLEHLVQEQFRDYWSYLHRGLVFDCRNTREALPDLPPPPFDRDLVVRLLRFAREDGWGRERSRSGLTRTPDLGRYLEEILPGQIQQSTIASALPRGLQFALDIRGPGGGQWACHCGDRTLAVRQGPDPGAALTFRMDVPTFDSLLSGRQTAQKAFFDGRIEMDGDMEKALKLAMLIEQFLAQRPEHPYSKQRGYMPLADARSTVIEGVQFPAGAHLLEGELAYPEETDGLLGGVVLAGSHPLLGGNMHNNVVRGLGDGLAERGLATLRFNYRGVGRSEGPSVDVARHMAEFWETSHVAGEMDLWRDVQGAVDFLCPLTGAGRPLVLIGYSFGCALLPSVRPSEPPAALVLIAPPLGKHDYSEFEKVKSPLLVIVSEGDFTLEPARLRRWFDRLAAEKELVQAPRDNHFFRGHEPWLVDTVSAFLKEHLP